MPLSNPASFTAPSNTSTTSTGTTVAGTTSNISLLPANASRKGVTIWNNSTANLFIDTASNAPTTAFSVKINAGGYYELPFGYTGAIFGVWDAVNGSAFIREFI
jgi:hypothetical protein